MMPDPLKLANDAEEVADQARRLSGILSSLKDLVSDWESLAQQDRTYVYFAQELRETLNMDPQ